MLENSKGVVVRRSVLVFHAPHRGRIDIAPKLIPRRQEQGCCLHAGTVSAIQELGANPLPSVADEAENQKVDLREQGYIV